MIKNFVLYLFLAVTAFSAAACSSSKDEIKMNQGNLQTDNPTLSFTIEENGKQKHFKAAFSDGEIVLLNINGKQIPEEDIYKYEDLIYDKLDDLNSENQFSFHFEEPFFNKKEFKENMKEMRETLKESKIKIHANILNDSLMKRNLENALEQIKEADDFSFHFNFNEEDLENAVEQLNEELENLDLNFDLNIDVDADMDEIEIEIEKALEKLGEIHIELDNLDADLKNLNNFVDELKSELVKDDLIKSKDEKVEIEIHADEMTVSGKEVSGILLRKYKKMYKKYFGKELGEDESFEIHK